MKRFAPGALLLEEFLDRVVRNPERPRFQNREQRRDVVRINEQSQQILELLEHVVFDRADAADDRIRNAKALQPGLLEPHVKPLLARLRTLLGSGEHSADEIERRIRILHLGARAVQLPHFECVASGVLGRKRLDIVYRSRGSDETTSREISPQRLVHYRENWYVDAWCHLREDLRSFSLDAIQRASLLETPAKTVPDAELDEVLASGYGIFSGRATTWAKLRFTPERARWVGAEQWHPHQKGRFEKDGSYVLELPYADSRELVMDILRHGPEVEVLEPKALRQAVQEQLEAAAARYRK